VLLAEDEPAVRDVAVLVLQRNGFTVDAVADGAEAVARFAQTPAAFDLLFFDVMMPGLGGFEAAQRCQALRAEVPVLFASGYAAGSLDEGAVLPAGVAILQKPYKATDLLAAVQARLAR
jgi:CheY-like chemotaxis protein